MGVFFYVYFGVGSQVAWVFGNIAKEVGVSSSCLIIYYTSCDQSNYASGILQVGLAYAFGIVFAITVCSSTSGGHFNPCVTITMVIFKGFPARKAVRFAAI